MPPDVPSLPPHPVAGRPVDDGSFHELVRQHEGRVRAACGRIVHLAGEVEDCMQRAFTSAWRGLDRFDGRSRLSTWLHRIAVNEALMLVRQRRPREELRANPADGLDLARLAVAEPVTDGLERAELARLVRARVAELPEDLRVPLVLRDLEEWPNQRVADELGLSLSAAKARIHRARAILRAQLALDLAAHGVTLPGRPDLRPEVGPDRPTTVATNATQNELRRE